MSLCSENFKKWHRVWLDAPSDSDLQKIALCHMWREVCIFFPEGSALRAAAEEKMPEFEALLPANSKP